MLEYSVLRSSFAWHGCFQHIKTRGVKDMGELVAVGFNEPYLADALLYELNELGKVYPVDVEDAAVIIKEHNGGVEVKEEFDPFVQMPISGALYFGFLGAVLGWILVGRPFVGLQIGILFGWIAGAVAGRFAPASIPNGLAKELEKSMEPGQSILLVSARNPWTSEKIVAVLKKFNGNLLKTSLSASEETKLRQALVLAA
jgi:uncharacterized membrane protein